MCAIIFSSENKNSTLFLINELLSILYTNEVYSTFQNDEKERRFDHPRWNNNKTTLPKFLSSHSLHECFMEIHHSLIGYQVIYRSCFQDFANDKMDLQSS